MVQKVKENYGNQLSLHGSIALGLYQGFNIYQSLIYSQASESRAMS